MRPAAMVSKRLEGAVVTALSVSHLSLPFLLCTHGSGGPPGSIDPPQSTELPRCLRKRPPREHRLAPGLHDSLPRFTLQEARV